MTRRDSTNRKTTPKPRRNTSAGIATRTQRAARARAKRHADDVVKKARGG
jgi:hypothetical protein